MGDETITTLTGYDLRGNVEWTSIPMRRAEAVAIGITNTPPADKITRYSYDAQDRQIRMTYPDGSYSTTEYGTRSVLTTAGVSVLHPTVTTRNADCFDADPATVCGTVTAVSDAYGRVIQQILTDTNGTDTGAIAGERITSYNYDPLGRLIGVTDPGGASWSYTYDSFGNRTVSDDPDLGRWTLEYDANDNLTRQTDAKGQVIAFTYDALDRVLTKSVQNAGGFVEDTTNYTYDSRVGSDNAIGQLVEASNAHHRVVYSYHTLGGVTRETHEYGGRSFQIDTEYGLEGLPRRQALPVDGNGNTAWAGDLRYDGANRLIGFGTYITDIDYNLRSQPTEISFGNGTTERLSYDAARGWLDSTVVEDTYLAKLMDTRLTRSASGRIMDQWTLNPAGRAAYTYDYAGRLLQAQNTGQPALSKTYAYNAAGSLASKSGIGAYNYDLFDHPHAPTSAGGQTFQYDANGNMTTGRDGKEMSYDAENRPRYVTHQGSYNLYLYGADGSRVAKYTNEDESNVIYLGPIEIRNFGKPHEQLLTYPHPSVRLENGGNPSYMHRDYLSSVRLITNAGGTPTDQRTYAPFGEMTAQSDPAATPETKGWIGERFDAGAGLQYLNARYYDPELGLFLQPDWFEVTEPGVGTNRYSYSFNDPVNRYDRGGNSACGCGVDIIAAVVAAVGIVAANEASDIINDGERNGNGALQQTADAITDGVNGITESVFGSDDSTGLSSGNDEIDGVFGGFDGGRDRAGQSFPGTHDELKEKLEELAGNTPGAKHIERPDGGTSTELPDGTKIATYPGRTKSGTNSPGFSVTKPGQKPRNGIKGTIEGGANEQQDEEDSKNENDDERDEKGK